MVFLLNVNVNKQTKNMLGKGSSGQVSVVEEAESKWLEEQCAQCASSTKRRSSWVVKKVFHLPGTEALAEFYFGRFLSQRYPQLFVRPLYLIHALDYERYNPETQGHYILYMEQEPVFTENPSSFDPSLIEQAFEQLARALSACGVIHNDIHLHNLFIDSKQVKLYDFGKSSFDLMLDQPLGKKFCTCFNAPELWERKTNTYYDNASDLWSIGLCLLFLFHSQRLLFVNDKKKFNLFVQEIIFLIHETKEVSPFLQNLLQLEPTKRLMEKKLTTRESAFLQLPWVNRHKKLSSKFVKIYSTVANQFVLTLFQRNKFFARKDSVCILLGTLNLFLEYILTQYHQDKTYRLTEDSLVPYVDACRALVIHILCPTRRFHTDSMFREIQYLVLKSLQYEILYQPLQILEKNLPCNFVGEKTSDLFPLIGLLQFKTYPFFQ